MGTENTEKWFDLMIAKQSANTITYRKHLNKELEELEATLTTSERSIIIRRLRGLSER